MYHQIGAMSPFPRQKPQFASLYFHDMEYATQTRKAGNALMDENILKGPAEMFQICNKIVRSFLTLRDPINSGHIPHEMELVLHAHERTKPGHVRKYNVPETSEVAVLIVGKQHGALDIVLRRKAYVNVNGNEKLYRISIGNRLRDPLCYPLIFLMAREVGTRSRIM